MFSKVETDIPSRKPKMSLTIEINKQILKYVDYLDMFPYSDNLHKTIYFHELNCLYNSIMIFLKSENLRKGLPMDDPSIIAKADKYMEDYESELFDNMRVVKLKSKDEFLYLTIKVFQEDENILFEYAIIIPSNRFVLNYIAKPKLCSERVTENYIKYIWDSLS